MTLTEQLTATGRAADWTKFCTPLWEKRAWLNVWMSGLSENITLATRGKDDPRSRAASLDMAQEAIAKARTALDELELAVTQAREACR